MKTLAVIVFWLVTVGAMSCTLNYIEGSTGVDINIDKPIEVIGEES